jgi:hypothetical protein
VSDYQYIDFSNFGYVKGKISSELLVGLQKESEICERDNSIYETNISRYEGCVPHYNISDILSFRLANEIKPLIQGIIQQKRSYIKIINFINKSAPIIFDKPWMNIYRSGDHLPLHNHYGVYSYSVWVKLPPTSMFQFLYTSTTGQQLIEDHPLIPKDEGTVLVFPGQLMHVVYPFSYQDEVRVSVSGNIMLDVRDIDD